jgi:uncharacterized protein
VKLWIDALTPKQALFAKALVDRAPSKTKCTVTSRKYSELDGILKQIGLEYVSLGKHGGKDLVSKLKSSLQRQKELFDFATDRDFDCSLCFISPEASRVSFGLGMKHYVCSDSPHAQAPCRLAVPLATKLFYPFPIRAERWMQYGVRRSQLFPYHALDPWAWILDEKRTGSHSENPSVVIRLEEAFASYFKSGKGVSSVIDRLIKIIPKDFEITIVPRYDEQRVWAQEKFAGRCIVPTATLNGTELIARSSLVIGGGGTMTQEAALLGIPNISYFPSANLDVFENFYFPRKLSERAATPNELLSKTEKMIQNISKEKTLFSARAKKAVGRFEDPVKFIYDKISE